MNYAYLQEAIRRIESTSLDDLTTDTLCLVSIASDLNRLVESLSDASSLVYKDQFGNLNLRVVTKK